MDQVLVVLLRKAKHTMLLEDRNLFVEACFRKLFPQLQRFAFRWQKGLADDLILDVFVKILTADLKLLPDNNDKALIQYVFKIAYYECVNSFYASGKSQKAIGGMKRTESSNPYEFLDVQMDSEHFIGQLPPREEAAFRLYLEGFSYKEITKKLQAEGAAAKHLIYRAKGHLRSLMLRERAYV